MSEIANPEPSGRNARFKPSCASSTPLSHTVSGPGSTMFMVTCEILSSVSSPDGPAPPVTIGASVGAMSMRSGVFGGSWPNSGTINDSSVEVMANGGVPPGPSRSMVVNEDRIRPHSVWPRSSWLKPALEIAIPRPYGMPATGVVAPNVGKASLIEYEAVKFGAPGGGMHCPGPDPTLTWKRELEPRVMPTLSSATVNSGDSNIRPRPAPTGPEIEIPASVGLDRIGDRAVLRPAAVRVGQEAADPVGRGRLDVGQEGLNDVADDRRVAETGGEGVVEARELDAERADQVDVDVRGVRRVGLQGVVAGELERARGQPQAAVGHQAAAVDVDVDANVDDVDVADTELDLRIDGERQVAERRRRVGDA